MRDLELFSARSSRAAMILSQASAGDHVTLQTLPGHPALCQRLKAMGIKPGVRLEVIRRGRPGGILHLAHGMFEFMLRQEHARQMEVCADEAAQASSQPPA
jgi:ferrous iron transport protein A